MSLKPRQRLVDCFDFAALRHRGPRHHDNRHAKFARSVDLRAGPCASGILRDHEIDGVTDQKLLIACRRKRSSGNFDLDIRQRQLRWRIDEPHEIPMLRLTRERGNRASARPQKDTSRWTVEGLRGSLDVPHFAPSVASAPLPGWTQQRNMGKAEPLRRVRRVPGDDRGERVGGRNQVSDARFLQVRGQPVDSAEAADPCWQWQSPGLLHPARKRNRGIDLFHGENLGQGRSLGRAAEDQKFRPSRHCWLGWAGVSIWRKPRQAGGSP